MKKLYKINDGEAERSGQEIVMKAEEAGTMVALYLKSMKSFYKTLVFDQENTVFIDIIISFQ